MNGFLGIFVGILLGLIPGLHINQIAPFIFGNPISISVFIVSAVVVANFFEFIKSSVFSLPNEGEALAVNPMQKLSSEGRMLYGLKLLSIGALSGALLCSLLYPLLIKVIPLLYMKIKDYVAFILLGLSVHLILKDKSPKKATIYFIASGLLGLFALNTHMKNPLLPLLSGLFGISSVIFMKKNTVKQMEMVAFTLEKKELIKGSFIGFFSSLLLGFIPAIGPSQASIVGLEFDKEKNHEQHKKQQKRTIPKLPKKHFPRMPRGCKRDFL